ncbi:MAG: tRNA-(ms[2]io[6]A)-hydroxylase [Flavobacteriales bacterium]|nr:tRNA-(ms[2]io[6]A)-hydroxylase [Flavobacteriales bacterium]
MLKLQLPTDPKWANVAEGNIKEILIDHAFCEQKAASNAISIITKYPEYSELVEAMSALAIEEMEHFRTVHEKITERGWKLGRERKDNYVNEIAKFFNKSGHNREETLVHKLLFAAMIEARSCERFKVLSDNIDDNELAEFYLDLMISEANHYTMFLKFAHQYGDAICDVDAIWNEFLKFEAEVIKNYGTQERIHG